MMHLVIFLTVTLAAGAVATAQQEPAQPTRENAAPVTMRLWEAAAPLAQGDAPADIPSITIYAPPANKRSGAAIVVCPGGGYGGLAAHEGKPVAEWLNSIGVTGIVLKYRLGPKYHHPVELMDVSRAIRTARARAKEWELDPQRVGVLGFSAGGHLASTAATHFDEGDPKSEDPVERQSSRPDLAILIYPVISMQEPYGHVGSRRNLLGNQPDAKLIDLLSNQKQVTAKTPPCFLVHGADDKVVPVQNSLEFALACSNEHVPVELHLFEHGAHGFGLGGNDPILSTWPTDAARWLGKYGFVR
jgi:acetyl esterase/lipase